MSSLRERLTRPKVRPGLLRTLAVLVTVVGASIALIAGQLGTVDPPQAGEVSAETYTADRTITVRDDLATQEAQDSAADAVDTRFTRDPEVQDQVQQEIEAFFAAVTLEAYFDSVRPVEEPPEETTTTTSSTTSTTFADEGGEPTIPVPNLLGSTEDEARISLFALGLNTVLGDTINVKVLDYNPETQSSR